jgi:acyl-CoA thioesterase II
MKHAVRRATDYKIDEITLDDLALTENEEGTRWMQFQRLGVQQAQSSNPAPEQRTYTSVGAISRMDSDSRRLHALGLVALSDYHVLDGPPHLHGLSLGQPAIGDTTRAATRNVFDRVTSLSHNIHFNVHDGFRADNLCYIEVQSPWASRRRSNVHSRIFTPDGTLIATCVQEAYYVLASGKDKSNL